VAVGASKIAVVFIFHEFFIDKDFFVRSQLLHNSASTGAF
jgi:hypothetical protein